MRLERRLADSERRRDLGAALPADQELGDAELTAREPIAAERAEHPRDPEGRAIVAGGVAEQPLEVCGHALAASSRQPSTPSIAARLTKLAERIDAVHHISSGGWRPFAT